MTVELRQEFPALGLVIYTLGNLHSQYLGLQTQTRIYITSFFGSPASMWDFSVSIIS